MPSQLELEQVPTVRTLRISTNINFWGSLFLNLNGDHMPT